VRVGHVPPECIVSRIDVDVIPKNAVFQPIEGAEPLWDSRFGTNNGIATRYEPRPSTPMAPRMSDPSHRKLAGIALIVGLIVLWAAFVASLAQVVGKWPVLVQAPYYLFMGVAWVIPLKPLVRWIETGSFRSRR